MPIWNMLNFQTNEISILKFLILLFHFQIIYSIYLKFSKVSFPIHPPTPFSEIGNNQAPTNVEESPLSQFSIINSRDVIDLNDNFIKPEDIRESDVQWKWEEDKLLIIAWLNVLIDPLIGTDQRAKRFGNEFVSIERNLIPKLNLMPSIHLLRLYTAFFFFPLTCWRWPM